MTLVENFPWLLEVMSYICGSVWFFVLDMFSISLITYCLVGGLPTSGIPDDPLVDGLRLSPVLMIDDESLLARITKSLGSC